MSSVEENEFMARLVQGSIADAEKFQRAIEGQKSLFNQLAKMEQERNHWKQKYEEASAMVRQLMNDLNRK
jgi:flagellar biosynthesis/type III secretory pathway chaperone